MSTTSWFPNSQRPSVPKMIIWSSAQKVQILISWGSLTKRRYRIALTWISAHLPHVLRVCGHTSLYDTYSLVICGKACCQERLPKRQVLLHWYQTMCSKYINHSRFINEHNWEVLCDHKENLYFDLLQICISLRFWSLNWQSSWLSFANRLRKFPIWSNSHNCLWIWKCPQ